MIEIVVPREAWSKFRVQLGGVTFVLELRWNAVAGAFTLDLLDATDAPLVLGTRLVTGFPLHLANAGRAGLPAGALIAADVEGLERDATPDTLGRVVKLYFVDPADLEGVAA